MRRRGLGWLLLVLLVLVGCGPNEEKSDSAMVDDVESMEEVVEDLELEDFMGYWASFDASDVDEDLPFGNPLHYFGEEFYAEGYVKNYIGRYKILAQVLDYEIEGNTITLTWEELDPYALGYVDGDDSYVIDRVVTTTKMTLVEAEGGRDQLIHHGNGQVVLRVSEEELEETPINGSTEYNLIGGSVVENGQRIAEAYDDLPEDNYIFKEEEFIDSEVEALLEADAEAYVYNLYDLSVDDLHKEYRMIQGEVDHPEDEVDRDELARDLIRRDYIATPSYKMPVHIDAGLGFSDDRYATGTAPGSVEIYTASVEEDIVDSMVYEIDVVDFVDHVLDINRINADGYENSEMEIYRISADVIYLKDHLSEFTKRYEAKTVRGADEVRLPGDPLTAKNSEYSEEEILLGRAWETFGFETLAFPIEVKDYSGEPVLWGEFSDRSAKYPEGTVYMTGTQPAAGFLIYTIIDNETIFHYNKAHGKLPREEDLDRSVEEYSQNILDEGVEVKLDTGGAKDLERTIWSLEYVD